MYVKTKIVEANNAKMIESQCNELSYQRWTVNPGSLNVETIEDTSYYTIVLTKTVETIAELLEEE